MNPFRRKSRPYFVAGGMAAFCVLLLPALNASFDEAVLTSSIVTVSNYRGRNIVRQGSGFVVQSDRFNGYVVAGLGLLTDNDTLTVAVPDTGAELIAQILVEDDSLGFAVLKVNGLDLVPVEFSAAPVTIGETVWVASKPNRIAAIAAALPAMNLAKGTLEGNRRIQNVGFIQHSAAPVGGSSLLLNDCGQAVGISRAGAGNLAVDMTSVKSLLMRLNLQMRISSEKCVSELDVARDKAELAAAEARRAQGEAEKAQRAARTLEARLKKSSQQNDSLAAQTRAAKERAESALREAGIARGNADNIRQELESKTADIKAETSLIVETMNRNRLLAEQRFEQALSEQKRDSEKREIILLSAVGMFFLFAVVGFLLIRGRGVKAVAVAEHPRRPDRNA